MMRLVKLCVIAMALALLGGCASVSDGPLPTFKNIAGYPEKLPDSSTTVLTNTVQDTMDARQSNIAAWNSLAERFDNYMQAESSSEKLDEQIEALVARYEYEWRELPEAQKRELMMLYHMAARLPGYGWPYTGRDWQKQAADKPQEDWTDLQKEMRLRAKPSTWIPTRRNISEEETKKWMTFYSLHRVDVRTFWLSLNLMLDRVRMEALPLAVLPAPATFDTVEPAKAAFDGFPAFDHFMRSQLYTMADDQVRQNMTTTPWQDL